MLSQTMHELEAVEELLKDPKNIPYQSGNFKKIKKAADDIEKMNPLK